MNNRSLEYLHEKLMESGYIGSTEELNGLINASEQITELDNFHYYMNSRKRHSCDKDKLVNLDNFVSLVDKFIVRFDANIKSDIVFGPRLYFSSRKNSINGKAFTISIEVKDNTNSGSGGYYGTCEARLIYGYKDRKRGKTIIFKDKEAC